MSSLKNRINAGQAPSGKRPATEGRPLKNRSGTSTRKPYNPQAISVFVSQMKIGEVDFGLLFEPIVSVQ